MAKKLTEKMLKELALGIGSYELNSYCQQLCGEACAAWGEANRVLIHEDERDSARWSRYEEAVKLLMIWMPVFYYNTLLDREERSGGRPGMWDIEEAWDKLAAAAKDPEGNMNEMLGALFNGGNSSGFDGYY